MTGLNVIEKHIHWMHVRTIALTVFLAAVYGGAKAAVPSAESGGGTTQLANKMDIGACTLTAAPAPLLGIAWPLLALLVILLVAFNSRVGRLFGLLPRFVHKIRGPAGIEIEFNAEAAKEVRANLKSSYE